VSGFADCPIHLAALAVGKNRHDEDGLKVLQAASLEADSLSCPCATHLPKPTRADCDLDLTALEFVREDKRPGPLGDHRHATLRKMVESGAWDVR
jgi:hypothetical protein